MTKQPFSLDKINYEAIRRQKRKKLLIRSLVPVVIMFLIALWLILPSLLTHQAIGSYKQGSYQGARKWLTPLTLTSPEPFVIAFNSGTVDTRLAKYDRAEAELTRALAIAPIDKRCMAAQNLVASLRAHATSLGEDDKEATVFLKKSLTIISANQICFKGSAASGGSSSQSDSSSDNQALTDTQKQQLQQKEQEGRERQAQYARDETFDPNDPKTKPW
jgi:predicted Zn-dependent protease